MLRGVPDKLEIGEARLNRRFPKAVYVIRNSWKQEIQVDLRF